MKRKEIGEIKDTKFLLPVIILGIGAVFFLLEIFNIGDTIKDAFHWVSDPVAVGPENAGKAVSDYFSVLIDIPGTQNEINDLRLKVLTYEGEVAYVSILEEENESLRNQLNLGNKEHTYIEAKVLGRVLDNTVRINAGDKQGIEVGDTVSLGYHFIGIVMETSENISTVRLPYSKSSSLEVRVVSEEDKEDVLSKAVTRGSGEDYIIIENISKKAGVNIDDYVIVNDERVSENLVLGKISGLNLDPANTSVSGEVVPIIDFDNLISVFVCIE
jgi:cell shape-determining protein MreC